MKKFADWMIEAVMVLFICLEYFLAADMAICENRGSKSDQAMQRIAALDNAARALAKAKE